MGQTATPKLMAQQLHFEPNVNHLEHPLGPMWMILQNTGETKIKCISLRSVEDEIHPVLGLFYICIYATKILSGISDTEKGC